MTAESCRSLLKNNLKERLRRNQLVVSITVCLVRDIEVARIAHAAGFDTLYIDLEHSNFSLETTSQICLMALEVGITPFVRLPNSGPDQVSRVLEGGALGVIAPRIQSAAEARAIVAASKFEPLGRRTGAARSRHLGWRPVPPAEANAALSDATAVIVQIETAHALDQVEEIAAVDGLDVLLIGSNDLLADMGIPGQYEHEALRAAYARTIAACQRNSKHVGVGGLSAHPDLVQDFVRMGARFVSTGTDLAFLLGAATQRARLFGGLEL